MEPQPYLNEPQHKMKKKPKRKLHPVHAHHNKFNKSGLINASSSFSNSIIAGSYKRKVKDLLINNKALARALEEANCGIAIRENSIIELMRTASNTRLIRTKAREAAATVHKLDLEMFELMSCLDDAINENEKTMSMLKENENNPDADLRKYSSARPSSTKSVKPQGNFDHNATATKSYTQIDAMQAAKRILQEKNVSAPKDLTIITEVSMSANTSVLPPVLFEENSNGESRSNENIHSISTDLKDNSNEKENPEGEDLTPTRPPTYFAYNKTPIEQPHTDSDSHKAKRKSSVSKEVTEKVQNISKLAVPSKIPKSISKSLDLPQIDDQANVNSPARSTRRETYVIPIPSNVASDQTMRRKTFAIPNLTPAINTDAEQVEKHKHSHSDKSFPSLSIEQTKDSKTPFTRDELQDNQPDVEKHSLNANKIAAAPVENIPNKTLLVNEDMELTEVLRLENAQINNDDIPHLEAGFNCVHDENTNVNNCTRNEMADKNGGNAAENIMENDFNIEDIPTVSVRRSRKKSTLSSGKRKTSNSTQDNVQSLDIDYPCSIELELSDLDNVQKQDDKNKDETEKTSTEELAGERMKRVRRSTVKYSDFFSTSADSFLVSDASSDTDFTISEPESRSANKVSSKKKKPITFHTTKKKRRASLQNKDKFIYASDSNSTTKPSMPDVFSAPITNSDANSETENQNSKQVSNKASKMQASKINSEKLFAGKYSSENDADDSDFEINLRLFKHREKLDKAKSKSTMHNKQISENEAADKCQAEQKDKNANCEGEPHCSKDLVQVKIKTTEELADQEKSKRKKKIVRQASAHGESSDIDFGKVSNNADTKVKSTISIQEDASKSSNVKTRKRKQITFTSNKKKGDSKPSKKIESESHNGAAATDVREQDIVAPLQANEVCDHASTAPTLDEAFIPQNKKRKAESDKNQNHVKPASKVNTDSIPQKTKKSVKPKTMEKQDNILDKPEAETPDLVVVNVEVHKEEDQIRKSEQKPSTSAATSTLQPKVVLKDLKKFRMGWEINDSITVLSTEDCESQATPPPLPPPPSPPSQPEELGRRSRSQSTASVKSTSSKDSNDMNPHGRRSRANVVSYKEPTLKKKMRRQ